MTDSDTTRNQILSAAAEVIIRLGYDKTNMSDIAEEAGLNRRTIYLHFKGKEQLFEALVYREWLQYAQAWMEFMEADPRGGTLGGYTRASMRAINSRPLIAAMMRRDRRFLGSYLRKPDNLFAWLQSGSISVDFIRAMQAAGAVRQDLDPAVTAYIIEMMGYGMLAMGDYKPADQSPPIEAVMEALAELMDRMFTPEGGVASLSGANSEAGKADIRQIVAALMARFAEVKLHEPN